MSICLLLLDAFRSDYLSEETTPFLSRCARQGEYYRHVKPSYGYCERTEILTGLSARESGFFTAIGYDPERSPYRNVKGLRVWDVLETFLSTVASLGGSRFAGKISERYRRILGAAFRRRGIRMMTYQIPLRLLSYWALTEDEHDHRDIGSMGTESLLDLLHHRGRRYFYDAFTALGMSPNGTDQDRLNMALAQAGDKEIALYLIYQSCPDRIGHVHGPGSQALQEALRTMDEDLRVFTESFHRERPDATFVFLGDHGMLHVEETFDAETEICDSIVNHNLRCPDDVLFFLDSTVVRIWFLSEDARQKLKPALLASTPFLEKGTFLDAALAERNGIPWGDPAYGNLIWLADPGVLVFPDFFHRHVPCNGMHGYDPEIKDSQGMCIMHGPSIGPGFSEMISLTDTYSLLKERLQLT
jgi:predicted AlkP superfamily pyrophosphatase or phosphodiesterase